MNGQIDLQESAIRQQVTGCAQTIAILNTEDARRVQNAASYAQLAQQRCDRTP